MDREPGKKRRDLAQARAVAAMIREFLPQLRFDEEALQAFPSQVREQSLALIGESGQQKSSISADW